MNPSWVRFGSADIYAVTGLIPDIADSVCVGQERDADADGSILLSVKMKQSTALTSALEHRLKLTIRDRYSSRHIPRYIYQVTDIPYLMNGKKCEIDVKHIVSGHTAIVSGTVSNPEALILYDVFQKVPQNTDKSIRSTSKL